MVTTGKATVNFADQTASPAAKQNPNGFPLAPADFAHRPLFEVVADLLMQRATPGPATCAQLNDWLEMMQPRPLTAGGSVLRFVAPDSAAIGYEERIFTYGEVVTRPDNWHDFFNALVWMRFARSKAALNALHVRIMRRGNAGSGRGPVRDAATQFDESGIVVASADSSLLDLLARRSWRELFWVRRADVVKNMRFLVFGHGLYDALHAPFYRMCARAATVKVEREVIDRDVVAQCAHVDTILAQRFAAEGAWYPRPRALLALPVLGIPGVTAESECAEYYADTGQFRPRPAWI
jgi:hypothetical protein